MHDERINEERIFQLARQQPNPNSRSEYLDQVCSNDPGLRKRVEALLAADGQETDFLKSADGGEPTTTAHHPSPENPGTMIGRYRLMEQIGAGGMGTVFVAQQDKPIRRKLALKVIKPGMDSQAVIARFEAERQALAMMDHPNIAKVLDAGTTDSGRPYFVMELVSGIEITDYCDQRKMSIRERLELFTQVCQAIQHAHQKGIIHRDIKTSNVLVTEQDGKAIPKVIDFGVAKAVGQSLTDRTIYTSYQSIVGTPLYMSPEQAALSNVDVDTRSDVYSLGVLLYELLTGATPFDKETFRNAAQDEVLRMIREKEPPKPSTRISTLGACASKIFAGRSTDMDGLGRIVRGDLDWIVMKALEKDRNRRYGSASGLADDVTRHLTNEPVVARPPTAWYRLRKFYARNRTLASTTTLVLLALVTGLGLAIWGIAERQKTLTRFRKQIVFQGIERTLNGDQGADETIQIAEAIGVEDDWIATLKGSQWLHEGELEEAKIHFSNALECNPQNISAWALQSITLYHLGEIDNWNRHMLQRDLMIAQASRTNELEQLFLAYAELYVNFERSATKLDNVIEAHPSWIVPHMIQAAADAEHAWSHNKDESIHRAIKKIGGISEVGKKIRFVEMGSLFVCMVAKTMGVDKEDAGFDVKQRGDELAESLAEVPNYGSATMMRAGWYDAWGNVDKAAEAWGQLLQSADGNVGARAIAEVYARNLDVGEVCKSKKSNAEAVIGQAYIWAIQEDQESREKADIILSQYLDTDLSYIRFKLLPLLLLLRNEVEVKKRCDQWLDDEDAIGSREEEEIYFEETMRFLARRIDGLSTDSSDPYEKQVAQFISGLRAFAEGNRNDAIYWMEQCKQSMVMGTERSWARAMHAHWTKEKFVPGENDP